MTETAEDIAKRGKKGARIEHGPQVDASKSRGVDWNRKKRTHGRVKTVAARSRRLVDDDPLPPCATGEPTSSIRNPRKRRSRESNRRTEKEVAREREIEREKERKRYRRVARAPRLPPTLRTRLSDRKIRIKSPTG